MWLRYGQETPTLGPWLSMPSRQPFPALWRSVLHHQGTESLCMDESGMRQQRMLLMQLQERTERISGATRSSQSAPQEGVWHQAMPLHWDNARREHSTEHLSCAPPMTCVGHPPTSVR